MALVIKDYDQMVEDVLTRIVDANIGITNIGVGSVIRTIVESILPEVDIANYNIQQAHIAKLIDEATGDNLDDIGKIFSVTRKSATYATGAVTFSTTEASDVDISIQYNQIMSTRANSSGEVYEAMVTDDNAYLPAGQLSVTVNISMMDSGYIYLPAKALCVISTSIIGINSVSNASIIQGGTNVEEDEVFRARIKDALSMLGKGTILAIESALKNITGVIDAMALDMESGIGTVDVTVVTSTLPPPTALSNEINLAVANVKSGGILVNVIYPSILYVDTTVTTTGGDNNAIGAAILDYTGRLSIGDTYIKLQMERFILEALDDITIDISVSSPASNVVASGTQVIKSGIITVNGVIYGV